MSRLLVHKANVHANPSFLFGWAGGRRLLSGMMEPFGWEIHLKAWLS